VNSSIEKQPAFHAEELNRLQEDVGDKSPDEERNCNSRQILTYRILRYECGGNRYAKDQSAECQR